MRAVGTPVHETELQATPRSLKPEESLVPGFKLVRKPPTPAGLSATPGRTQEQAGRSSTIRADAIEGREFLIPPPPSFPVSERAGPAAPPLFLPPSWKYGTEAVLESR